MSLTAHNQFFGWVHSFKLSRNNSYFNPGLTVERPFPAILEEPTFVQVMNNWNYADTGLVATSLVLGTLLSKRIVDQVSVEGILGKRFHFNRMLNICLITGVFLGLNNSANRLLGFVPNGLPKKRTKEVLKYDYTSQFVSQTPWKYLYSGRTRPSNQ